MDETMPVRSCVNAELCNWKGWNGLSMNMTNIKCLKSIGFVLS